MQTTLCLEVLIMHTFRHLFEFQYYKTSLGFEFVFPNGFFSPAQFKCK